MRRTFVLPAACLVCASAAHAHFATQLAGGRYRTQAIEERQRVELACLVAKRERNGLLIRTARIAPGP